MPKHEMNPRKIELESFALVDLLRLLSTLDHGFIVIGWIRVDRKVLIERILELESELQRRTA